jgi:hypothetical protein
MTADATRKRGRPPKPEQERKDTNLTFRVTPELRDLLERQANAGNRSVSAEIERALFEHYHRRGTVADVLFLIGEAISFTETKIGRPCFSDEQSERACRFAADIALDITFRAPPRATEKIARDSVMYKQQLEMAQTIAARLIGRLSTLDALNSPLPEIISVSHELSDRRKRE